MKATFSFNQASYLRSIFTDSLKEFLLSQGQMEFELNDLWVIKQSSGDHIMVSSDGKVSFDVETSLEPVVFIEKALKKYQSFSDFSTLFKTPYTFHFYAPKEEEKKIKEALIQKGIQFETFVNEQVSFHIFQKATLY